MKETTKTKTIPTQLFQEGTQKFAIYVGKKDIFNSSTLSEKKEIDCNYYKNYEYTSSTCKSENVVGKLKENKNFSGKIRLKLLHSFKQLLKVF